MARRPLLKSILTLSAAGLLVRAMGFVYRVLLVRMTGSEVIGVFQMTYPLFRLCATVASLGMPVALSKTVAESLARKDDTRAQTFFRVSFSLVLLNSLIASAALLLGAHALSEKALSDNRTHLAVITMSVALIFTCMSGILRGYFHGHHNATPPAIAQVMEQGVRIAVTAGLAPRLMHAPVESAAAIVMLAMGVGEAASFVTLLSLKLRSDRQKRHTRPKTLPATRRPYSSNVDMVSELLTMSLPLTAVGFISSVSHTVDALVIPRRLLISGFDSSQATVLFGRLSGMAMPVLFLPGLIVFPIATMLLPEVAASMAHGSWSNLSRRLRQIAVVTAGITIIGGAAMFLVAPAISSTLYGTDEAAGLIAWYAPAVPLLYMGYVLGSALNGLGKARLVFISTAAGALLDFAVLYHATALPKVNIYGAIIADMAGFALVTLINAIGLIMCLKHRRAQER